jgi:hypothetical protein
VVKTETNSLKVADQCWVGLALLHKEHRERSGFKPDEILDRIQQDAGGVLRPGVRAHISAHNIANIAPNPGTYRMYVRQSDGTYRLYRPGDPAHPKRRGKTAPDRDDVPTDLQYLLDWYENVYCKDERSKTSFNQDEDPVLAMLGVGKELWLEESGDEFIKRERQDW